MGLTIIFGNIGFGAAWQGKVKPEKAATAFLTIDIDGAAHGLNHALADGQTKTGTPIAACRRGIDLGKGIKDRLKLVVGNANPFILNRNPE